MPHIHMLIIQAYFICLSLNCRILQCPKSVTLTHFFFLKILHRLLKQEIKWKIKVCYKYVKNIYIFLSITKQNFWRFLVFWWSKWGLRHYVSCAKSIAQVHISVSHLSTGLNISCFHLCKSLWSLCCITSVKFNY